MSDPALSPFRTSDSWRTVMVDVDVDVAVSDQYSPSSPSRQRLEVADAIHVSSDPTSGTATFSIPPRSAHSGLSGGRSATESRRSRSLSMAAFSEATAAAAVSSQSTSGTRFAPSRLSPPMSASIYD